MVLHIRKQLRNRSSSDGVEDTSLNAKDSTLKAEAKDSTLKTKDFKIVLEDSYTAI